MPGPDTPDATPPAGGRPRPPATLAALAVAAMPDIRPVAVGAADATREGVDLAVVHDDEGRVWMVAAPRGGAAGAELEAEVEAVALLSGRVPFVVPRPAASVDLRGGGRAVVYPAPTGRSVDLTRLASSPRLCHAIGRALAALHQVPAAVVERAGVPVYDAEEVRRRRLSELDRGAETGQVPPVLLHRWEAVLEDRDTWRFPTTVVHGDLVADRVVATGDDVSALLDWTQVHVGDPAQDLAWLAVGSEPETTEAVLHAYAETRAGGVDEHFLARAVLHGEMALVKWLLHGERTGTEVIRSDARAMLEQLAGWVTAEAEAVEAERVEAEAERVRVERAQAQAEADARRAAEAEHAAQAARAARAEQVAETAGRATEPIETLPDGTEPDRAEPLAAQPTRTVPGPTVPIETVPEGEVPEGEVPEGEVPVETAPEEKVPDQTEDTGSETVEEAAQRVRVEHARAQAEAEAAVEAESEPQAEELSAAPLAPEGDRTVDGTAQRRSGSSTP